MKPRAQEVKHTLNKWTAGEYQSLRTNIFATTNFVFKFKYFNVFTYSITILYQKSSFIELKVKTSSLHYCTVYIEISKLQRVSPMLGVFHPPPPPYPQHLAWLRVCFICVRKSEKIIERMLNILSCLDQLDPVGDIPLFAHPIYTLGCSDFYTCKTRLIQ